MNEMTLDERKATLLEIMDYVDEFCKEHHLRYFLTGGTLLGAIRHKGFIPWDDDIDIAMPRQDYDVFAKIFNKDNQKKFRFFDVDNTKGYYLPFGKVVANNTILVENIHAPIELGVNVDVFPIDKMGDDLSQAKLLNKTVGKYRSLLNFTYFKFVKRRGILRTVVACIIAFFAHYISRGFLINKITQLAKKYDGMESSKYMAIIVMMTYGEKEIMESKWFDDVVSVSFEGRQYCAPIGYNDVLTHFYNDYMQLPPVEKRVSHHSNVAWWRD